MTITLEDFLNELPPEHRQDVEKRGQELIDELVAYNKAFDFFMNVAPFIDDLTLEEIQEARETTPTVHELSAAIYVAVVIQRHSYKEAFSNALVIIEHWGKLAEDPNELSHIEAIRALAASEEYIEEMKNERAELDIVLESVQLNIKIYGNASSKIEAGLRVLYEYHLWDLEGKADEVEMQAENT